jgi:pimeloyl-ACP methyl ester carboxylesterase
VSRRPGLLPVLAAPAAPVYGAALAYAVYHPPRRSHHRSPADFGLPSRELHVPVPGSRVRLHAWLCPGASPDRVVVIGHGIGLSKSAALAQARFLHEAGYTVCLFDFRNHGASTQDRAWWDMSRRFTADIAAVVRHLHGTGEYARSRFAVYGFSFSSFPVFFSLQQADYPVDAVVCDSGPTLHIDPLFGNFLKTGALPVPRAFAGPPARTLLERSCLAFGNAMLKPRWPPTDPVYDRVPALFLAGADDPVVPVEEVRALADRYSAATVTVLPGVAHLDGMKVAPDDYRRAVLGFLDSAWAKSGRPAS